MEGAGESFLFLRAGRPSSSHSEKPAQLDNQIPEAHIGDLSQSITKNRDPFTILVES